MKTIDIHTVIDREKLSPLQWLVFALGFLVFFVMDWIPVSSVSLRLRYWMIGA